MTSYLRSWLSYSTQESPSIPPNPTILASPPKDDSDDDDNETIKGDEPDDDEPPAFPSINSAQRLDAGTRPTEPSIPRILSDAERMPPPPLPGLAARTPGVAPSFSSSSLAVPLSGSSLSVPLTTTKVPAKKASRKVALAPGHGPLDWANLKKSGVDLRVSR